MREEFHWEQDKGYKQYYGWNSMNVNVWLPSLSELVGITGTEHTTYGCYNSAMQGLNISIVSEGRQVDMQGGEQFAFFHQFNQSGGGEAIWNACAQEIIWLRTSVCATAEHTWQVTNAQRFDWVTAAASLAVHPAVVDKAQGIHNN